MQLDPQSPYANGMAGLTHLMADRVEEALKLEREAVEIRFIAFDKSLNGAARLEGLKVMRFGKIT